MRAWANESCPTCKAGPHEMCRTKDGNRCKIPHTTRPIGSLKAKMNPMTRQMETIES